MRITKKLLAVLLSVAMLFGATVAMTFGQNANADAADAWTGKINITDSTGEKIKEIGASEIKAADAVQVSDVDPWTYKQGENTKTAFGTFYPLKGVLQAAGVDISQAHGLRGTASDFLGGFSAEELDKLYVFEMSEVTRDGKKGTPGTFGTAINGSAGNKWITEIQSLGVANDHVIFRNKRGCQHYCAICGADEDTVVDPAVAPAVGKEGKTAGSHYLCGAVKDEQKVVPALKAQPMTVKAKTAKVKAKKLKKKAQKLAVAKIMTIKNAQGDKSFKITKVNKKKFKKYFKINAKSGQLTIKKKLKKGTYKVTAQITAAGNATYGAGSKTVTFKIKVK